MNDICNPIDSRIFVENISKRTGQLSVRLVRVQCWRNSIFKRYSHSSEKST